MAVSEPWGTPLGVIGNAWQTHAATARLAASEPRTGWQTAYRRRLAVTDFVIVMVAVFGAQFLRFGEDRATLHIPRVQRQQLRPRLHVRVDHLRRHLAGGPA